MGKSKYHSHQGSSSILEKEWEEFLKVNCKINVEFKKKFILQEKFIFNGKSIAAVNFIPDAFFPDENIAMDLKGVITETYALKKKLFQKVYGIDIIEVTPSPVYLQNYNKVYYISLELKDLLVKTKKKLKITGSPKNDKVKLILEEIKKEYKLKYDKNKLYAYIKKEEKI